MVRRIRRRQNDGCTLPLAPSHIPSHGPVSSSHLLTYCPPPYPLRRCPPTPPFPLSPGFLSPLFRDVAVCTTYPLPLRSRHDCYDIGATAAKEAPPPPPPADSGQDSDDSDAPNLLGGAYESSEDDEEAAPVPSATANAAGGGSSTVTASSGVRPPPPAGVGMAGGQGGDAPSSPSEPGEDKKQIVEKMVGYVAKNGRAFEERVRKRWAG